jgi:hypothetical protein
MIIFFLAARSSKSEEKEQNLVVTPSSVENTVRRGTIVRKTFPIGNTRRHVPLYSVYCSVRQKFLTVFNLIMAESYVKIFPALHVGWSVPNLCMSVPET